MFQFFLFNKLVKHSDFTFLFILEYRLETDEGEMELNDCSRMLQHEKCDGIDLV